MSSQKRPDDAETVNISESKNHCNSTRTQIHCHISIPDVHALEDTPTSSPLPTTMVPEEIDGQSSEPAVDPVRRPCHEERQDTALFEKFIPTAAIHRTLPQKWRYGPVLAVTALLACSVLMVARSASSSQANQTWTYTTQQLRFYSEVNTRQGMESSAQNGGKRREAEENDGNEDNNERGENDNEGNDHDENGDDKDDEVGLSRCQNGRNWYKY